jgi:hypothetical protein
MIPRVHNERLYDTFRLKGIIRTAASQANITTERRPSVAVPRAGDTLHESASAGFLKPKDASIRADKAEGGLALAPIGDQFAVHPDVFRRVLLDQHHDGNASRCPSEDSVFAVLLML